MDIWKCSWQQKCLGPLCWAVLGTAASQSLWRCTTFVSSGASQRQVHSWDKPEKPEGCFDGIPSCRWLPAVTPPAGGEKQSNVTRAPSSPAQRGIASCTLPKDFPFERVSWLFHTASLFRNLAEKGFAFCLEFGCGKLCVLLFDS